MFGLKHDRPRKQVARAARAVRKPVGSARRAACDVISGGRSKASETAWRDGWPADGGVCETSGKAANTGRPGGPTGASPRLAAEPLLIASGRQPAERQCSSCGRGWRWASVPTS